jgi:predicted Zn-ribbon and HTH transcriptional regulator
LFDEKKGKRCPICNSSKVQKWGFQNGKQRYRCGSCLHNFSIRNEGVKLSNQFVWFYKWIMERQVYNYLVRDSGMSQSSLQRLFKNYLESPPQNLIKSKGKVHLLIDGTYFSNELCLILYYDYDIQYVQLFRTTNQEKYKEIKEDLENLKKLNVNVYSVTCDGHKAIMKAVKKVYPNAVIQRCVVHIKRQVKNLLSTQPKIIIAKELLLISNKITAINTIEQASIWLVHFHNWYLQNQNFINKKTLNEETGRWWYTHRNLHLATTHLINAIPNLFCYLNDEEIPSTTNQLEGYFTHLKEKVTLHRGLKFETKKQFIKWYLYFKNNPIK